MMITALGRRVHHAAAGPQSVRGFGLTGESILKIAGRAVPFVFFMLLVVLLIAYLPEISTTLLPDSYQ